MMVALLGLLLLGPTVPQRAEIPSPGPSQGILVPAVTLAPGPEPVPALPGPRVARSLPPVVVRGSGFGHGVGLSQYGAQAQALSGRDYHEILNHYYPGTAWARASHEADIAVNLFSAPGLATSRVLLQTSSRAGRAPYRNVAVHPGGGGRVVEIPFGSTWSVNWERGDFVVRDGAGVEQTRGRGPARVTFAYTDHEPTLLRLPQLDRSYQWGWLRITARDGQLRPVLVVGLERYLRGLAEMPAEWHADALKAQAVAARTFALRRTAGGLDPACDCHLGTGQQDQVYAGWGQESRGLRWVRAVNATAGEVLLAEGSLAFTPYSSSHGGRSERSADSWAFESSFDHLPAVEDPWSTDPRVENPYAHWEVALPNAEFARVLELREVHAVRVLRRTPGGSPASLEIDGVDRQGQQVTGQWDGPSTGVAAADLKFAFRAELPSQQISSIGFEPFVDDDGLAAERDIVAVNDAGVMGACERVSRRFCPDGPVTRGELATYLARGLGMVPGRQGVGPSTGLATQPASGTPAPFDDIAGTVHEAAITGLAARGAVIGCDAERFCPGEPLSVADAAAMFVRARTLSGIELERVVPGCDRHGNCPARPFTRQDAATALANLFGI